jgi:hypothetical protein
MTVSRREALLLGASAVAMAALPVTRVAPSAVAAPTAPMPAWAVGTPGEFNFQHIIARTAVEAERIFRSEYCTDSCEGEEECPCGDCDFCCLEVVADRVVVWDGKEYVGSADWFEAGMGTHCARCGYETFPDTGYIVTGDVVCEDCMRLPDWDIVDPQRAADMREEDATLALSSTERDHG